MLKTILNPRQTLKVIQIIHRQIIPKLSPDYVKTWIEKTEINTTEKLKLLEQYDTAKSIILSDAQNEYKNKQSFEFPKETSEIETERNRTFNLYPNVIVKQKILL